MADRGKAAHGAAWRRMTGGKQEGMDTCSALVTPGRPATVCELDGYVTAGGSAPYDSCCHGCHGACPPPLPPPAVRLVDALSSEALPALLRILWARHLAAAVPR